MKCPSCEHENVAGTTFCELCGEELESDTSTSPSTPDTDAADTAASSASLQDSNDILCPACENKNPADNIACEVCGTELSSGGPAGTDEDEEAAPTNSDADVDADTDVDTGTIVDTNADTEPDFTDETSPDAAVATEAEPVPTDDTATAATTDVDASQSTLTQSTSQSTSAPLAPGKVKLVVEQGMVVGKQFVLGDQESQVGREDEDEGIYPDIDLSDQDEGYVHREHATLTFEDDALFVTHLGGGNKTRLNNKPIPDNEPQPIKLGDKLAFGKVVLRVLPL